jgi:hypothetical protein
MSDKKFELGDYVEVKDRIKLFYELFGQGRLVTERVELTREPDDKPKVIVYAKAYRNPDDTLPGTGTSWLYLPGKTPYTNGSEIENCETSAWGRAIGALGILIDRSIASAQEVQNKEGDEPKADKSDVTTGETLRSLGDIERSGAVAKGSGRHSDLEWRQTPDGYHIGFLLEVGDGKAKPQVSIEGPLAVSLYAATAGAPMNGMKVTVKGELWEIKAPNRRTFYRIVATSIETPDWKIPPDDVEPHEDHDAPIKAAVAEAMAQEDDLSDLPDEWKQPAEVA